MKIRLQLFFIILFTGLTGFLPAQEKPDITGVWSGQIYNDSTQKYLPFELAISLRNGDFTGYSYTVFLIDSVENIGVKEVTISEKDGIIKIKDKRLIDDNYSERPDKGVYTTMELKYSENDTARILSGKWYTNKTRRFYPLSGTAFLNRRKDYRQTRIMQRLAYLGIDRRLSFWSPANARYASNDETTAKESRNKDNETIDNREEMMTIQEPELVIELPRKDTSSQIKIPQVSEVANILKELQTATTNQSGQPAVTAENKTKVEGENKIAARDLSKRKIETIQSVPIRNDSIVLSLFDNGTIDGDTVSVILNGRVVISKIGLLATAYNQTVHLTPEMGDSIKLVLYAENLGSIPPNTGLLVVRDGDDNHEIRFSGDLKQNSAIILLRNRKE